VKGVCFSCNAAAFDFAHDRGLALRGLGLLLRGSDLAIGRRRSGFYLMVSRLIGRFDLTVRRCEGAVNGYAAGNQRQQSGGKRLPMVENAQRIPKYARHGLAFAAVVGVWEVELVG
jgi:hypothetical protein